MIKIFGKFHTNTIKLLYVNNYKITNKKDSDDEQQLASQKPHQPRMVINNLSSNKKQKSKK